MLKMTEVGRLLGLLAHRGCDYGSVEIQSKGRWGPPTFLMTELTRTARHDSAHLD